MDPLTGSALISAGSSLLSGAFGASSNRRADKQSMEVVTHGIRHRVNDAKKAGLHPLYALGANISSPQFSTGNPMGNAIADAGAAIGEGMRQSKQLKRQVKQDQQTVQLHQAQLLESHARTNKDNAQAALFASEVKRAEQRANHVQDGSAIKKAKTITIAGVKYEVPPWASAQEVSDLVGDVLGEAAGAGNYGWMVHNKATKKQQMREKLLKKHPKRITPIRPVTRW